MTDLLTYALKVNGSIVLFYLFYILLYRRDTFWKVRRAYLLIAVLFSFLYPLMQFGEWFQRQKTVQVFASAVNFDEIVILPQRAETAPLFTTENILLALYVPVAFALLFKIITQVTSILIKIRQGEKTEYNGIKMIQLNENITPFSFFHLIFLNKNRHTPEELPEILTHELSHVRQRHSYDVLLSELLTALCWFNPFAWLLKKELKQNLEFLADNQVINAGFETKKYQYLLLNTSCNYVDNQLINQFNISPIKKRITMMNKQKTSRKGLIKYTLIIPVALIMLIISNAQNVTANVTETLQSKSKAPTVKVETLKEAQSAKKSGLKPPVAVKDTKSGKLVYEVVDVPPAFPGGDEALMKFLKNNIQYPVDTQQKAIQGRVIVQFIVDETGKVINPEVARGVHPSLDAEALRVIKAMPAWTPGKQKGKNVSVRYYLPVLFRMQGASSSVKTDNVKGNAMTVTGHTLTDNKKVYDVVDVPPAFPGGMEKLIKFLSDNIIYPVEAHKETIQGRVITQFVVDGTGKVMDAKIVRGVHALLDAEALRVVNSMPNWTPGKQGGQNVSVRYTIPINFRLSDNKVNTRDNKTE